MPNAHLSPKNVYAACGVPYSTGRWWRHAAGLLPEHSGREFSHAEGLAHFLVASLTSRGLTPRAAAAIANALLPALERAAAGAGGPVFVTPRGAEPPEICEVPMASTEESAESGDDAIALALDLQSMAEEFARRLSDSK